MKQTATNRLLKVIVCIILVASLMLPAGLLMNSAEAAAKPSIPSKITIGTGSTITNFDYYEKDQKFSIRVSDPTKKATYTFTSSNTKVVAVKANGAEAYLTGLKAGTATITCTQKLNGKSTKVGTCAVTVKNATVSQDSIPTLPLGNGSLEPIYFTNRNHDGTYTYTSNSKNFTIKETISTFDGMCFIKQSFTATAAGTYTITVKETYNKVTRTVGTLKYTVKKATVVPNSDIDLGSDIWVFELIQNFRSDVNYYLDYDKNIVDITKKGEEYYLAGKGVGTTEVNIYENTNTADKSKFIGTCKVSVKEVVLEELDIDFDDTEATVGDDPVELYIYKTPENAPGTITVTSSNTKVATVSNPDEEGLCIIEPVGAGTTTITITCGNITKTQEFTVYSADEDDDYYDDEE